MLRYIFKTLFILFSVVLVAQVPQAIKYQAVCRDASGNVRSQENVDLRLAIHQFDIAGPVVYEESHAIKTNKYGLFSVNLGKGSTTYDFSSIEWGQTEFFLEVSIDGISMGASQLLSVPYALHANDASSLGGASAQEWDKAVMDLMAEVNKLKSMINKPKDTLLMKSANGDQWKVAVNNDGEIVTVYSDFQIKYSLLGNFFNFQKSTSVDKSLEYIVPCDDDVYNVYIHSDGYYSDLKKVDKCKGIKADLTPINQGKFCGVAMTEKNGVYQLLSNEVIQVFKDEEFFREIHTGDNGQFAVDLSSGRYIFHTLSEEYYSVTLDIDEYADLQFRFIEEAIALKPNIYLYPDSEQNVEVELSFPCGGQIDVSEPLYGDGWDVNIKTDGTVDDKYGFLFYESTQPDKFQYREGWVVAQNELSVFFSEKLHQMNFNATEINDFIDYWIPMFKDAEYYQIYPQFNQEIDPVAALSITPEPASVFRLWFCVKESKTASLEIDTPELPVINRDGFEVVEWGVVLK